MLGRENGEGKFYEKQVLPSNVCSDRMEITLDLSETIAKIKNIKCIRKLSRRVHLEMVTGGEEALWLFACVAPFGSWIKKLGHL